MKMMYPCLENLTAKFPPIWAAHTRTNNISCTLLDIIKRQPFIGNISLELATNVRGTMEELRNNPGRDINADLAKRKFSEMKSREKNQRCIYKPLNLTQDKKI